MLGYLAFQDAPENQAAVGVAAGAVKGPQRPH